MLEADDGDCCRSEQLCGLVASVAGNNLLMLVDENRRIETECFDAPRDCPHLPPAVLSGIARIRLQVADWNELQFAKQLFDTTRKSDQPRSANIRSAVRRPLCIASR